ncbi:MAG: phytanoyl-CoA dioxygenase family protein [Flavobacteriales bacterium]|nr:phytanoyl-CoA dioxygenase family protein [Flavobacteriales bacterium]
MIKLQFHQEEYSSFLYQEGSVFFPLLSSEEITALRELFFQHHPQDPQGFYATTHLEDKTLRKQISNQIYKIIAPKLEGLFSNIQVLGGAFISKAPGEKGILPLHQDWNIVDEEKARSYNLWIPLCDVNDFNGAMRILERSHLKEKTYRGPNISPSLHHISRTVEDHMFSVNMKAGEALIYDHALWHSSPVNQSKEIRLAIVMGIIADGADMKYYHQNGADIEEYNSHPNFFFENDRENGHKTLSLHQRFPFKIGSLDETEFEQIYLGKEIQVKEELKQSFFSSLFNRFKNKSSKS